MTVLPDLHRVKFGYNTISIKFTFFGSGDIIHHCTMPLFCSPFHGAPVECRVRQKFDKFWTNIQVLSNMCPNFVQVLSLSSICQFLPYFTKFCLKIVKILSKILAICPKIVKNHLSTTSSQPSQQIYQQQYSHFFSSPYSLLII